MERSKADHQYNILAFFQGFWRLWLALILSAPFLAAAWVYLIAAIEGAPEPAWWLAFEAAIGVTW